MQIEYNYKLLKSLNLSFEFDIKIDDYFLDLFPITIFIKDIKIQDLLKSTPLIDLFNKGYVTFLVKSRYSIVSAELTKSQNNSDTYIDLTGDFFLMINLLLRNIITNNDTEALILLSDCNYQLIVESLAKNLMNIYETRINQTINLTLNIKKSKNEANIVKTSAVFIKECNPKLAKYKLIEKVED